jgi:23S rRNA (pseudouridine1915-N3)-methyltransferase
LAAEGKQILAAMPPRSYRIAMCVEGQQMTSEQLAQRLEDISQTHGSVCLVIGSSYGIAPEVKAACDLRLSVSKLTFPHQLMRVILLEAVYRALGISKGTKYHK